MEIERMSLQSMDLTEQNREKLKQLFPSVFVESLNDEGEFVETIDFDKLKAELGVFNDAFDSRRERYGLDWPGKKDALKIIQQPSLATLKPCQDEDESVNFDATENLFIEGDNLEVLKLLQKSYYGKIKMIYIDPPYNTGNEFIYPDNYSESLDTYLAYAGLADDQGRKFATNTQNEGRYHTKWLNMMYPRLYLAKNLLRDDGAIFISIDDNEVTNLRKLCDEVFGEENFACNFIWKSRQNVDSRNKIKVSTDHEYIVAYFKNHEQGTLRGRNIDTAKYSNPDDDPRGVWMSNSILGLANASQRPNLHYSITDPDTGNVFDCPPDTGWRYSRETMAKKIQEKRIIFPRDSNGRPREKKFLAELSSHFTGVSTVLPEKLGYTLNGSRELRDLMDGRFFDFPKPVELLKMLIEQGTDKSDNEFEQIVLDFFAGSATTAHAVLELNKEDGGNRKFIMVQLPEPCEENTEAFTAGYKTIADIGKERIRRVIRQIEKEQNEAREKANNALPGLGEEIQELDLGFKVFKLDKSNFKIWDGFDPNATKEELVKQLELHINHIDPDSSPEDILYELLLKAGYVPTERVTRKTMAGKTVYSIADGSLLICLEDEITGELIRELAKAGPKQVICLDQSFKRNDQLKANAMHTFAAQNEGKDKREQIAFRTV